MWAVAGAAGLLTAHGLAAPSAIEVALDALRAGSAGSVEVSRAQATGLVDFLSTRPSSLLIQPLAISVSASQRARSYLEANRDLFIDPASPLELSISKEEGPDEVGQTHVLFQQSIGGVPVRGGEVLVHLTDAGITAVNSQLLPYLAAQVTTPAISAQDALAVARNVLLKSQGPVAATFSTPTLEIIDTGALLARRPGQARLSWYISISGPGLWQLVWVDAGSGELVLAIDQLAQARNRVTYDANDTNTVPATPARTETSAAASVQDVNDAHDYAGNYYNYFFTEHQRDSFDGNGATIISVARFCEPTLTRCPGVMRNAFWDGQRVNYGSGFALEDVVAHELTHALIQKTANLVYANESGALNESYADIFGETIDLTYNVDPTNVKANDSPTVRWLVGEDLAGQSGGFRNMMNPAANGDPGKVTDSSFVCTTADNGGVHTNSGVPNHAYALMVDGGIYNGYSVTGIGLTKAAKIQYRALSRHLTSVSNFRSDVNALYQACSDLVGSSGITADDCAQVMNALLAVEMTTTSCAAAAPPAKPGPVPNPTPDAGASLCPAGAQATSLWLEDFENTAANAWSNTATGLVNHWNGGSGNPPIYFTGHALSGTYSLKATGRLGIGDSTVAMRNSLAVPQNAYLQFAGDFNLETGYDAGVIEYSTDNGSTWNDAGGLISAGRNYNGVIVPGSDNPLAGRQAFTGNSGGYVVSRLNLSSLAGRSVRFRFRAATDSLVASPGWYIDDLQLYSCASNTAPVATAQSLTMAEDTALPFVLSGSDADGNSLTFRVTTPPAHGLLSGTAPSLSYQPQPNFNGQDSLQFVANDGLVDSAPQTISIQVTPVNDPPAAVARTFSGSEDTVVTTTLSGTDVDGDPLTYRLVTQPANGTLSGVAPDLSYNPRANFNGSDSFSFVANDGKLDSAPATITLNIAAVNDPPVAESRNLSTGSGTPLSVQLVASDVEGSPLTFRITASPVNGTLSGSAPNLTYTPNSGFSGTDQFSFVANDGVLDSQPATISIAVAVGNQPPVASAASLTVDEDQSLALTLQASDPENGALTYRITVNPVNGTLSGTPPTLVYQPNANFNGNDRFSFVASDGALDSQPAQVSIVVNAVNDPPVADSFSLAVAAGRAAPLTLTGSDVEGSALSYAVTVQPVHGTLSGTPPALTYTPASAYTGADSLQFTVNDGALTSLPATVSLNVIGGNVPVADAQSLSLLEDATLALTLTGSGGSSRLQYKVTQSPINGTLSGTPPQLSYKPRINFYGSDSMQFIVSDGVLDSLPATISFTVQAVNDAPVVQAISQGIKINTATSVQLLGSDVDGDTLTYRVTANPGHGVLSGTPPVLTYTPETNFAGSDSFRYLANDGSVDSAEATVTITIAQTSPPVADSQVLRTNEDVPLNLRLTAADVNGDPLTFSVLTQPQNGTLSGTPPALVYTPAADFSGKDQFSFNASDGVLNSAPATISIDIAPVNDPPVADNLTLSVMQDTALLVPFSGSDKEGDALTFKAVTSPSHGSLISGAQGMSYRPGVGFVGTDAFTYLANDGDRNSAPASVLITVNPGVTPRDQPPTTAPGITITPTSGLVTTEAGGIASFDIVLDSRPQADVKITLSSSDLTEGRLLQANVIFTPDNWDTPQTVQVMGMTDRQRDGAVAYQIITAPAVSNDTAYNGLDPADVNLTNTEGGQDMVIITPLSGLNTNEFGRSANFTVRLAEPPAAGVILHLQSSDDSEGRIIPDTISFTQNSWDQEQTITVRGVDDNDEDGDVGYSIITEPVESRDARFNGVDPPDISVTNADNDSGRASGGGGALSPWCLLLCLLVRGRFAGRRRFTGC